jgi:hypothetical protein
MTTKAENDVQIGDLILSLNNVLGMIVSKSDTGFCDVEWMYPNFFKIKSTIRIKTANMCKSAYLNLKDSL